MAVAITSEPYNQTFSLSKEFILTTLAGSVLADALELDPEATLIPLTNPIITPSVMQFLVDYSQGREPQKHIPDLIAASRYLNLPWMLYYTDPLYDAIPNKQNFAAPENLAVWRQAIKENNVWIVGLLSAKGMPIDPYDLNRAIKAKAVDVVAVLLGKVQFDPKSVWSAAKKSGSVPIIKLLEATGQYTLDWQHLHSYLYDAIYSNQPELFEHFLTEFASKFGFTSIDPVFSSTFRHGRGPMVTSVLRYGPPRGEELWIALENNFPDIALQVVNDSRFDPNSKLATNLDLAAERGYDEIIAALLNNPKTRLNKDIITKALKSDKRHGNSKLRQALLQSPQLKSKYRPLLLQT